MTESYYRSMKHTIMVLFFSMVCGCGASATPAPIYLGHVATTSGPARASGELEVLGIRLALEELKREGQDRPVFVKHTDARGQLDAMEAQTVRLVTVSRVVALYGGDTAEEETRAPHGRHTGL